MIQKKSPEQIEKMLVAGQALADVINELKSAVAPGVTALDLDALAERLIRERGAVPSFLGYRARANQAAANANVHAALPAVEAYRADCGKYADATASECADGIARAFDVAGLKSYAPGLELQAVKSVGSGSGYCVEARVGGKTASFTGPGGSTAATACATD